MEVNFLNNGIIFRFDLRFWRMLDLKKSEAIPVTGRGGL
jgi:hypothetical protein